MTDRLARRAALLEELRSLKEAVDRILDLEDQVAVLSEPPGDVTRAAWFETPDAALRFRIWGAAADPDEPLLPFRGSTDQWSNDGDMLHRWAFSEGGGDVSEPASES